MNEEKTDKYGVPIRAARKYPFRTKKELKAYQQESKKKVKTEG